MLKGIIELCKKGVFASALIKKRRYWPKFIRGEEIKAHFVDKDVGDADSWAGVLDDKPFHVYTMKEPDYVMSLMSTYSMSSTRMNMWMGEISEVTSRVKSPPPKKSKKSCILLLTSPDHGQTRTSIDVVALLNLTLRLPYHVSHACRERRTSREYKNR